MGLEEHKRQAPAQIGFALITISDTRSGASDSGGAYLAESVTKAGHKVALRETVRDDAREIAAAVRRAVAAVEVDLVLTTGGTGIAPRDVTYETLRGLFESEIPGFGELFRMLSYRAIGSAALLSRATGGVLARKVVLALPGSPKALALAMDEIILMEAGHLVSQARGPEPTH